MINRSSNARAPLSEVAWLSGSQIKEETGNLAKAAEKGAQGSEDWTPFQGRVGVSQAEVGRGRFEWEQEWVGAGGVGGDRWLPGRQSNWWESTRVRMGSEHGENRRWFIQGSENTSPKSCDFCRDPCQLCRKEVITKYLKEKINSVCNMTWLEIREERPQSHKKSIQCVQKIIIPNQNATCSKAVAKLEGETGRGDVRLYSLLEKNRQKNVVSVRSVWFT